MPRPASARPGEDGFGFRAPPDGALDSIETLRTALNAICCDVDCTVLLVDRTLTVRAGLTSWTCRNERGRDPAGMSYADLLPPLVASEHCAIARGVAEDGQTTVLLGMIAGGLTSTTFRRLSVNPLLVLITVVTVNEFSPGIRPGARIETSVPPGVRAVRAAHDDVGRLDALTEREFEVLRMIGLGHTAQEISRDLHRSVKTVDGHRMSLGAKLGVGSKIDLARIAMSSGLTVLRTEDMPQLARHARLARESRGLPA